MTTRPGPLLREIATDIKIAHSVFALPFALLAAFMAASPLDGGPIDWARFAPHPYQRWSIAGSALIIFID